MGLAQGHNISRKTGNRSDMTEKLFTRTKNLDKQTRESDVPTYVIAWMLQTRGMAPSRLVFPFVINIQMSVSKLSSAGDA